MTAVRNAFALSTSFALMLCTLHCGSSSNQAPPISDASASGDGSSGSNGGDAGGTADGPATSEHDGASSGNDSSGGEGGDTSALADDGSASDSAPPVDSQAEASSCTGCPPPTCSISCIPHDISVGGSTTYYWNSSGTTCSLTCPGLNLQLGVPCMGQDSSHFQNLQQSEQCTLTATGPGGTVSCSDTVNVQ